MTITEQVLEAKETELRQRLESLKDSRGPLVLRKLGGDKGAAKSLETVDGEIRGIEQELGDLAAARKQLAVDAEQERQRLLEEKRQQLEADYAEKQAQVRAARQPLEKAIAAVVAALRDFTGAHNAAWGAANALRQEATDRGDPSRASLWDNKSRWHGKARHRLGEWAEHQLSDVLHTHRAAPAWRYSLEDIEEGNASVWLPQHRAVLDGPPKPGTLRAIAEAVMSQTENPNKEVG